MNNLLIDDMARDPRSRSIGRIITAISRYSRMYLTSELKDYDLMVIPLYLIHSLSGGDWIKQEDLIVKHGVDKAVMTRSLGKLVEDGCIEKMPDPKDRRASLVRLTDNGVVLRRQTKEILNTFNEKVLEGFNEMELKQLYGYLDRLLINSIRALEEDR